MTRRDEIMQALSSAQSWDEQIRLVAELDAVDDAARKTASAERSIDWADTTVHQTLAPGRTLDRHTAASDWLAEAETDPGDNHHQAVIAEASVWFQRLDPDVRADAGEFVEQAKGIARRTAGKYGAQAEAAADAFLQYVAFLNRQVLAASGLDQIQQQTAPDGVTQRGTPLPTDVFDNFAPPVHPINTGVDGTQTNSLAPGAEEAMAENGGSPSGRPSEHEEGQDPVSEPYYPPASAKQGSLSDIVGQPSVAMDYAYNMNDFLRAEAAKQAEQQDLSGWAEAPDASGEPEASRQNAGADEEYQKYLRSKQSRKAGGRPFVRSAERGGGDDDGSMPGGDIALPNGDRDPDHDGDDDSNPRGDTDHDYFTENGYPRHGMKKGAPFAGYKDFKECTEENSDKNDPDAYCGKIEHQVEKGRKKEAASGLDQVQQTVAPDGKTPRVTSLPTDVMFGIDQPWPEEEAVYDQGGETQRGGTGTPSRHESVRKQADMFGGGDSPHQVPGGETPVANSPATTPPNSNSGDFNKGVAQGQADAAAGERPSFADNSSKVSDFVRGYVQGYGTGQPDTNPQDVPASMGGDSGQGQNFGEIQAREDKPMLNVASKRTAKDYSKSEREKLADEGEARPDGSFPIKTKKDLQNAKHDIGRSDDPAAAKRWINERAKEMGEPGVGESKKKSALTVSAAMVTKDISGDAEFLRGYHYARNWTPDAQIVAMGSSGEEAGIYAGITDNPTVQKAWVVQHRKLAEAHPELAERLRQHKQVTAAYRRRNEDALVKGLYVQAATSLDLDTTNPTTSPDPQGATPFMGPGTIPELRDAPGSPAEMGGPAPYNGVEPMGQPVVSDPMMDPTNIQQPTSPDAVNMTGDSSLLSKNPQAMAFRKRVQAGKLALRKKEN